MPPVKSLVRRTILAPWRRFSSFSEQYRLAPLYSPDPSDLDHQRHVEEAMGWLKRAQDSGSDRGVAHSVPFGGDFGTSYPETTGYICVTFIEHSKRTGNVELLERAIEMGDWEIAVQLPDGAVMGGVLNSQPTPAIFNTGMVLLGWNALIRSTNEERFKDAARRAADWLVSMQEPDGNWIRGNSRFAASGSTVYNVKVAGALCETGYELGEERYIAAALRNAEYCMSRQRPNGWLEDCCLSDPNAPILHTLAYSMEGLIQIGKLTGADKFVDAAKRLADAQLRIMRDDGYLSGAQDRDFSPAVDWCCLTGSAQTSIVWSELYLLTSDDRYREAVTRTNSYLMARHDIRNADPCLRGGVSGSWPTWGGYGRLRVLNWATKYLVDALALEQRILRR